MTDTNEIDITTRHTAEDYEKISQCIDVEIIEKLKTMQTEKRTISDNIIFLEWYFKGDMNLLNDNEKQRIFSFMTYATIEDPYCFLRIMLYIANTRRTDIQEIFYKVVIHFLGTMYPEVVMANLELFIKLGKKDDVLYFLQCQGITERVITWIKHKAKEDSDFQTLLDGKMIGRKIQRKVYYKPKLTKYHTWDKFLYKILDDATFNGITL
jgi:hypothetical protein